MLVHRHDPPDRFVVGTVGEPGAVGGDDGSKDVTNAWIYGVIGLVLCICCVGIVFNVMGLLAANRAADKGHPGAQTAKIFNIVCIALWALRFAGGLFYRPDLSGFDQF